MRGDYYYIAQHRLRTHMTTADIEHFITRRHPNRQETENLSINNKEMENIITRQHQIDKEQKICQIKVLS